MEAPQSPVDIKITLGNPTAAHNLLNIDIDFSDTKEEFVTYVQQNNIQDVGKDFLLVFDLYVEAHREQEAIAYLNTPQSEKGRSPLQILFANRPQEHTQDIKFEITPHQGFVRVQYHFIVNPQEEGITFLEQMLQSFSNSNVKLQAHINLDIKGIVSHNKKNRTNVKVDYTQIHLLSNTFSSQNLINSLTCLNQFQSEFNQIINNPFMTLIKQSKMSKINLKMDSFRKINKFYNDVNPNKKQIQDKEFKYLNKGIFRQRADATLFYNQQYMVKAVGKFQSQDVWIRLIKVYSKFFEKVLSQTFYYDD